MANELIAPHPVRGGDSPDDEPLGERVALAGEEAPAQAAGVLRERYGFDFVGVSLVPEDDAAVLEWMYAAGSTSNRYELIRLPKTVGALGKVYALGRGIVVDSVDDDIPAQELFQYPIVIAEGLSSFFAFPLMRLDKRDSIAAIIICATRFVRTFGDEATASVQRSAAELFGLAPCSEAPVRIHGDQQGFAFSDITHRLLMAHENERRRIARELHDGISQEVLVAQIELRKLAYLPQDEWTSAVDRVSGMLRDVIAHIGSVARALRPAALDELGLPAAIEALCSSMASSFGVQVRTRIGDAPPLGQDREIAVYRIFQEALTNACKYAEAITIDVSFGLDSGQIVLSVADDGKGFDPDRMEVRGGGLGLAGMRERANLVGGQIEIESSPGGGTKVVVRMKAEEAR